MLGGKKRSNGPPSLRPTTLPSLLFLMIHYLLLLKLKNDVTEETLESLMAQTRSTLLHIRETLHLNVGKKVEEDDKWDWFISLEVETLEKLKLLKQDPRYYKFQADVIHPHVTYSESHLFEMTPRKKTQFS